MTKKIQTLLFSLLLIFSINLNAQNLSELAGKYGFKLGTVISNTSVNNPAYKKMITNDFNSITASNEFKAYSLLNQHDSMVNPEGMPAMRYNAADKICDFAQENGIKMRGHVLVWDAYMKDWFFREGYKNTGKYVDQETMKKRLEYYINEVISHFENKYPGLIYCWDVVNEAVADGSGEAAPGDKRMIRTSRGGTKNLFYNYVGPDYVELSFKYAKEAVNNVNPDIKLYYNDYNTFMSGKRQAIKNLIQSINAQEKLCDGVGMQGYIGGYGKQDGCMNFNDITSIRVAILDYASLGVEVQITEMAVRNYKSDERTMKVHARFYESLFTELKEINKPDNAPLTAVTIWGITDNPALSSSSYGYKMNGPYCGIFTERCKKKIEYDSILKVLQ
ncbi:MAG: endo-1,4-beta-xylanase [Treponema sp.]|nr:endo-1,4-beta-xylanase [Treponema sp.]